MLEYPIGELFLNENPYIFPKKVEPY